jgi:hypothetical protein
MIPRDALARVQQRLGWNPAVLLLGPRQIGKTTLARAVAEATPGALWLDLERAADRRPRRFLLLGSAGGELLRQRDESLAWRLDFIQTLLQRDLRNMGVNVAAETLHRFWRMVAHLQGQLFNASQLALSLGAASNPGWAT